MYKLASITLNANTHGQIGVGLMVNPPKEGQAVYAQFAAERDGILTSLKRRAVKVTSALNKLEGVTCNHADGAM
jgi:alanine transaminase